MTLMFILHLKGTPIFEQLQLEEALLRTDRQNICIINEGSNPAIVMGISGKVEELVDQNKLNDTPLPIIRRYSGGGTVVVDESTLFVSFICQKDLLDFHPYPEPLMRWSFALYSQALNLDGFALRDSDYTIGEKKVGGNAQYLTKERFVHHTTFLWDYQTKYMDLLLYPRKTPAYRKGRSHEAFVGRLSDHIADKTEFVTSLKRALTKQFATKEVTLNHLDGILQRPHRKSTERSPQEALR